MRHQPKQRFRARHHPVKKFHPHHSQPNPKTRAEVEGVLQLKGNFGFVLSTDPAQGDVLIQGPSLKLAMDGDRVKARVQSDSGEGGRRSGVIVSVVERARKTVVGTFARRGNQMAVVDDKGQILLHIIDAGKFTPKVNDVVVARVTRWPTHDKGAAGVLEDVLGSRDTPGVDLEEIIRHFELPRTFSEDAERVAAAQGSEVPESALKGRTLFFDQRVFTIDGADAKDFDDAVSLEMLENGWRLGVHIADVAHYVTPDTALDKEAYQRGTSVYFTGSVLPMLPFTLSDNLCSLRPNVVRLSLSCVMDIGRDGKVGAYKVMESAIKSAKRFTYEEVEGILKGDQPANLDPGIIADVQEMGRLARLLREKRFGRGSLDFDFPEPDVVLDSDGRPTDIQTRDRLEAHRLIEEFMLLANETVARHMSREPFVYRIHETPDPARMEKLKKALDALGVRLPPKADTNKPSTLRSVLLNTEGTPLQSVVHISVLRSLKQAVYSPVNRGHYGLASECYTHFTSPIRRYPDLMVHRLVKEKIHGKSRPELWALVLPEKCTHCSKRERVAVDAEREFMDIQKVRLMESHVGEEFSGVVSSVTNFGIFVQLDQFFVEGLVHVTSLGDYYVYDESRMTLTGRRTGHRFSLGTKVKVRLAAANVLKKQLDFQLVGGSSNRSASENFRRDKSRRGHFKRRR